MDDDNSGNRGDGVMSGLLFSTGVFGSNVVFVSFDSRLILECNGTSLMASGPIFKSKRKRDQSVIHTVPMTYNNDATYIEHQMVFPFVLFLAAHTLDKYT